MSEELFSIVEKASTFITSKLKKLPEVGVVLGSGLYGLANRLRVDLLLPNSAIPGFPVSTVAGHKGRQLFGMLGERPVMLSDGRVHYYEGYPLTQVTLGMRIMAALGCKTVVLTSAVGGIRDDLDPGDLVIITDHINLQGNNPLIGMADSRFGERFVDVSNLYDRDLQEYVQSTAERLKIPIKKGVLTAMSGPSYETAAEVQMIRRLGGDIVGMSLVPEAIVAAQSSMKVIGISCVTNKATGCSNEALSHEEVLEVSNRVTENFQNLVEEVIRRLP